MEYIKRLQIVTQNLEKSQLVNSYDSDKERECDTLGHSLMDMEDSFNKIIQEYIPKLMAGDIQEPEVDDLLLYIGEELRHILYHIKDPKFYGYLNEVE